MHIILGGTGHVGSAVARQLLAMGERVTVVSRNAARRDTWQRLGADLAVVDATPAPG